MLCQSRDVPQACPDINDTRDAPQHAIQKFPGERHKDRGSSLSPNLITITVQSSQPNKTLPAINNHSTSRPLVGTSTQLSRVDALSLEHYQLLTFV